jgi:succinate-acetate transporter protein
MVAGVTSRLPPEARCEMSGIDPRGIPSAETNGVRAAIFLQPIAAPSVLGDFAGASGFLLFGVWLAGGLGAAPAKSGIALFPFILLFAGIGQLGAAMWSYKARDAVAASIHGAWGGFWLGYGFLWLLDAGGLVTLPVFGHGFEALGQWFIYMSVITWTTAFAALARGPGLFVAHGVAGSAAAVACAGLIGGFAGVTHAAGWVFVAASALFIYYGSALLLNAVFGRVVLPHFNWRPEENRLGAVSGAPLEYSQGEPGVKVGQ